MSAPSTTNSGGLVTFTVKSDGSAIPEQFEVYSIHIEQCVNRISSATLTILDGNAAEEGFKVSASSVFVPGNKIAIAVGYDSKEKSVFEGIIVKQALRVDDAIGSALEVVCKDEAVKMTVGRKSATFTKKSDSEVISQLIGDNGLAKSVTSTTPKLPELVQYYSTDWDFMLARAEVNSMIVTTLNGKVTVAKPDTNKSPVISVIYGDNLIEFNAELNAVTQLNSVKASSWDFKTQKVVKSEAPNNIAGPGNLSSKELSKVIGLKEYELQTTAPEATADLSNWSKGQMIKSEFSKIRGETRFQGSSLVQPANYITLDGMGPRFDGDHFVSAVTHDISEGNWITEVNLGLDPTWFTQEPDVMAPPAAGLLPGARGLFNATVKKMFKDPDSEYRILVEVPIFDVKGDGIWARLANFYSTSGAGAFFLPEVGDEVIVGFLNEDPRYPVILGSMYSTKHKPYSKLKPEDKNPMKGIVTKSELRVLFDDKNKELTIETPGKNKVVLSDKSKQVLIEDQNGNSIKMSSSGIDMKSKKNINIDAGQKVSIKGKTGVAIEASGGDVTSKGLNVKANASVAFQGKGGAKASLEGGAQAVVKGAMVMIN